MDLVNEEKKKSINAQKSEVRKQILCLWLLRRTTTNFLLPYMAPEYVIISKYQAISMRYYDYIFALIMRRTKCQKAISFKQYFRCIFILYTRRAGHFFFRYITSAHLWPFLLCRIFRLARQLARSDTQLRTVCLFACCRVH